MKGTLYGIGVGPGDPDLLTMKAVKALKKADVVVVPQSRKGAASVALEISKEYIHSDAEVVETVFPMLKDVEKRKEFRKSSADKIVSYLDKGKQLVFLTLGDPMLYSTYSYVLEYIDSTEYEVVTIPGIYSFSAMSARLNEALLKGNEKLAVVCNFDDDTSTIINKFDTVVFMKVNSYREDLYRLLNNGEKYNFHTITDLGKETEIVRNGIDSLKNDLPYFTTSILLRG